MLVGMLRAGLLAGALVTLITSALPERGRLFSRPICAAQSCTLDWTAASQSLRALGAARECPTCGAGPARSDILLELSTVAIFGGLYMLGRAICRGGEPLGTGDITIAALLGAMAGFPDVLTYVLTALLGGISAVLILTLGGSRKVFMPYGPARCLGGLWVMLFR